MKIREMQSKMEAILFAAGEPMEIGKLGQVLELDLETVEKILRLLADRYG